MIASKCGSKDRQYDMIMWWLSLWQFARLLHDGAMELLEIVTLVKISKHRCKSSSFEAKRFEECRWGRWPLWEVKPKRNKRWNHWGCPYTTTTCHCHWCYKWMERLEPVGHQPATRTFDLVVWDQKVNRRTLGKWWKWTPPETTWSGNQRHINEARSGEDGGEESHGNCFIFCHNS